MRNKARSHPFEAAEYEAFVTGPDTRKIIVLKEKGKVYRALNDSGKQCVSLQIDGGIIKVKDDSKCDKGLIVLTDGKFYLVELKGVDVSTACSQLLSTLKQFQVDLKDWNYEYLCRAVVAEMPSKEICPTSYRMLKKLLKDRLVCKSKQLEEHI
ncbi:MAG: hypothetical protein K6G18_12950 [Treponema sp.]|nr:hypothetical protein [Treponema sp.]